MLGFARGHVEWPRLGQPSASPKAIIQDLMLKIKAFSFVQSLNVKLQAAVNS